MYCYNCGKEIDDKAVICVGCGVPVIQKEKQGKQPGLNGLWNAYIKFWQNYANARGVASVEEYWGAFLFNALFSLATSLLLLSPLYLLATLIPSICLSIRRLHDTGRSGWYLLLNLIPIVGSIILIVWYCQSSSNFYIKKDKTTTHQSIKRLFIKGKIVVPIITICLSLLSFFVFAIIGYFAEIEVLSILGVVFAGIGFAFGIYSLLIWIFLRKENKVTLNLIAFILSFLLFLGSLFLLSL